MPNDKPLITLTDDEMRYCEALAAAFDAGVQVGRLAAAADAIGWDSPEGRTLREQTGEVIASTPHLAFARMALSGAFRPAPGATWYFEEEERPRPRPRRIRLPRGPRPRPVSRRRPDPETGDLNLTLRVSDHPRDVDPFHSPDCAVCERLAKRGE